MDCSNEFDLNHAISKWENANFSQDDLTPADQKEFKSHILDCIDELKETGLSEEEVFTVAQMRLGTRNDWGEEMKVTNEDNFQLRKIILIFSGFILYVFSYNLILCSNRIVFLVSNHINGDLQGALNNAKTFFYIFYALSISGIVAIYFLHQPVKWLLQKTTISLRWGISVIIAVGIVVTLENYLIPLIAREIEDVICRSLYYDLEFYFKYIYSFIIGIGYFIIFLRFSRKYYG